MMRVMFRLAVALLAFGIGVSATLVWRAHRQSAPIQSESVADERWPPYGTLGWQARMAKARGESTYNTGSLVCGMAVSNLNDALKNYSIVVAQPFEKKTILNDFGLTTWYKFRMVETLTRKPAIGFQRESLDSIELPSSFLPEAAEFLVPETGGSVEAYGVTINQTSNSPQFSLSKTYLLFLQHDWQKRVGFVPWPDEVGIFTVDADGMLTAVDDQSQYDLKEKMASRFGNSVKQLRLHFARDDASGERS
ncbi:MAG: hypothetical protein ACRD6N_16110, partial [Pyrinomonadaceae bacterium]